MNGFPLSTWIPCTNKHTNTKDVGSAGLRLGALGRLGKGHGLWALHSGLEAAWLHQISDTPKTCTKLMFKLFKKHQEMVLVFC